MRDERVVGMSDDLVEGGLAVSMSRPGGNTTGVSIFATDLDAKRLEVLHECVPQARHIGILVDPTTTSSARQLDRAARDLSLELRRLPRKTHLKSNAHSMLSSSRRPTRSTCSPHPY